MSNKADNSKCLLLNADFSPLRIISWKKAIIWSIKYNTNSDYGIEILQYFNDRFIHGACDKKYPVPAIAKTIRYFNLYNKKINFSRHNLFIRDNYTCQYCGIKMCATQLTYDHIIPKCRFHDDKRLSTNWTNIVTACRPCNHKKGNRTPKEAGMKLIHSPIEPTYSVRYLPWFQELSTIGSCYDIWKPFLNNHQYVI